jgi:hypothetical protein
LPCWTTAEVFPSCAAAKLAVNNNSVAHPNQHREPLKPCLPKNMNTRSEMSNRAARLYGGGKSG